MHVDLLISLCVGFYLHSCATWSACVCVISCADSGFSLLTSKRSRFSLHGNRGRGWCWLPDTFCPAGHQLSATLHVGASVHVCLRIFSHVINLVSRCDLHESNCPSSTLWRVIVRVCFRWLQPSWLLLIGCQSWAAQCVSGSGWRTMWRNPPLVRTGSNVEKSLLSSLSMGGRRCRSHSPRLVTHGSASVEKACDVVKIAHQALCGCVLRVASFRSQKGESTRAEVNCFDNRSMMSVSRVSPNRVCWLNKTQN